MTTETPVDTAALDVWLSEHLFDDAPCESCTTATSSWNGPHWHFGDGSISASPLSYSTTGDGMLMVIDEMAAQGFTMRIDGRDSEYSVSFDNDIAGGFAQHRQLPRAVACAAQGAKIGGTYEVHDFTTIDVNAALDRPLRDHDA